MPDLSTRNGLLDVIALGCIVEFTTALTRSRYDDAYDSSTDDECALRMEENRSRTYFRVLMKVFATKYHVFAGDTLVHASYIWQTILVRFASALVKHCQAKEKSVDLAPGMTPAAVEQAVRLHLQEDHPHLIAPFDTALKAGNVGLTWDPAVALEIVPKSRSSLHLLRTWRIQEADLDRNDASATVNDYYRGVWEGENMPHDDADEYA